MKTKYSLFFSVMLLLALFLGACSGEEPTGKIANPNNPTSGGNSDATVGLGGIFSKPGNSSAISTPVTLASGLDISSNLAMDATSLYWFGVVGKDSNSAPVLGLNRLQKNQEGGKPELLFSFNNDKEKGDGYAQLLVDETSLYYLINYSNGDAGIAKRDKQSGSVKILYTFKQPEVPNAAIQSNDPVELAPSAMVADNDYIYFGTRYKGGIGKVSKNSGELTMLVPANDTSQCTTKRPFVQDTNNLYYTDCAKSLNKVSKQGGNVVVLASFKTSFMLPRTVAQDESNLYWLDASASGNKPNLGIMKISKNGGTPTPLTVSSGLSYDPDPVGSVSDMRAIISDGTNLYWASIGTQNSGKGGISKVTKEGGKLSYLVNTDDPREFVMDNKSIYWIGGLSKAPFGVTTSSHNATTVMKADR